MGPKRTATIEDLWHVEGKAELVNGELVPMSAASYRHGCVSLRIAASLLAFENKTGRGHALPDNVGFIVDLPHRRSFSPDAAFATQTVTDNFVDGAPMFAAEVRSPDDFGPAAHAAADCRSNMRETFTRPMSAGTSMSGPITAAKAAPEFTPNTATATAIASSKLLLAAVNDNVAVFG